MKPYANHRRSQTAFGRRYAFRWRSSRNQGCRSNPWRNYLWAVAFRKEGYRSRRDASGPRSIASLKSIITHIWHDDITRDLLRLPIATHPKKSPRSFTSIKKQFSDGSGMVSIPLKRTLAPSLLWAMNSATSFLKKWRSGKCHFRRESITAWNAGCPLVRNREQKKLFRQEKRLEKIRGSNSFNGENASDAGQK